MNAIENGTGTVCAEVSTKSGNNLDTLESEDGFLDILGSKALMKKVNSLARGGVRRLRTWF